MSEQDEIHRRLDRHDERIHLTDKTASYALHLAAHADRDAAEVLDVQRGHTRVLGALRKDQVEQGAEIHQLRETQLEHGRHISELCSDMDTLKTDVSTLKDGVTELLRRTA